MAGSVKSLCVAKSLWVGASSPHVPRSGCLPAAMEALAFEQTLLASGRLAS